MADIDVVPKKRNAGWALWVVLAIVAVLIVWMLAGRGDRAETSGRSSVGTADGPIAVAVTTTAELQL